METVQQNGRFTLFSSKFLSIYSILYDYNFFSILTIKWTTVSNKNNNVFLNSKLNTNKIYLTLNKLYIMCLNLIMIKGIKSSFVTNSDFLIPRPQQPNVW